ncbi:hypothetical protein DRO69_02365 [Candidatus Bathyarchaeota archaeon]|nr:MAG: hypothetical protein DRO69_02365 [Candidatus Bathyarchaeota archaeon]
MSRKKIREEMKRLPRLIMSVTMAAIFWGISMVVPPLVEGMTVPGINVSGRFFLWVCFMLVTVIFVIRALADALSLADVLTDIFLRRLGAKEDRSLIRVGRDAIYIILTILLASAFIPILSSVAEIGNMLASAASLVALGLIILLIYDIGRVLYRTVEEKAEVLADRLVKLAKRNRKKKG